MEEIGSHWLKYVNNLITEPVSVYRHTTCHKCERKTENINEVYREVKPDYEFEKYLCWVKDRRHKSTLTKLRISAHKLHIEIERYKNYDKVSKT